MKIEQGLFYSKEHEWVRIEGNKAFIGITDFAQDQLGDVVFVELPEIGAALATGDGLGTIESVKAVSDIYTPLAGVVLEVNAELEDAPQLVNEDAYGKGWIAVLELQDVEETKNLLDAAAYEKLLTEEA